MGRRCDLTEAQKARILVARYRDHVTVRDIATRFGVSHNTVTKVLNEADALKSEGVETRAPSEMVSPGA